MQCSAVVYVDPEIGLYRTTKQNSVSDENRETEYSVSEESDTRQIQFEVKATGESKEEGRFFNNAGF